AEDESRIGTIYHIISEENVKKELKKPWISFGSDEASQAPEDPFQIESASARLRKFRAGARQILSGRKSSHFAGSNSAFKRATGAKSRAGSPRHVERRNVRRRGGV